MFKFLKSGKVAKALGWLGSALLTTGGLGLLGRFSPLAVALGGLLTGAGVHAASNSGPQPLFPAPKK